MRVAIFSLVLCSLLLPAQVFADEDKASEFKDGTRILHSKLDEECGDIPFKRKWGGFKTNGQAEFDLKLLQQDSKYLKKLIEANADETFTAKANAQLSLVRSRKGAVASSMYISLLRNYVCRLAKVYPAKADAIRSAQEDLEDAFSDAFYATYLPISTADERQEANAVLKGFRDTVRSQSGLDVLTESQALKAIDKARFAERWDLELKAGFSADKAKSSILKAEGCIGASWQSVEIVDDRVLAALGTMKANLALFLSGRARTAGTEWFQVIRDLTLRPKGQMNITVDEAVCIAEKKVAAAQSDNTGDENKPGEDDAANNEAESSTDQSAGTEETGNDEAQEGKASSGSESESQNNTESSDTDDRKTGTPENENSTESQGNSSDDTAGNPSQNEAEGQDKQCKCECPCSENDDSQN